MRVIVTDGGERAALAATRSLGRCGEVHVVSPAGVSLAGRSRWAAAEHAVTSALADPRAFRGQVAALADRIAADAILPVSDAATRALLAERDALSAVLVAPEEAAYRALSDKGAVAERARSHGIRVPPGAVATGEEQALALGRELGWPVVLKPVSSVFTAADGSTRKVGVARVADAEALRLAWRRSVGPEGALVQSLVPGWGEGVFVLRWQGRTLAAFAHRRLREKPPEGGMSVLRESIPLSPDLLRRVEAVLDDVGFEGTAMAELRSDGEHAWLMEFNARFWGSLQLAVDAGVDFPVLLVRAFLGQAAEPRTGYAVGVRLRWLLGDVDHALALLRGSVDARGRSGLAAALAVLLGSAGPRTRWEVLRREDPRPFLHEVRAWLRGGG